MTPDYSILLDIAALALVVLCAVFYARRGLVAGVLSFFGTLIAAVVAGVAAKHLSAAIWDGFFRPGIEQRVSAAVAEQGAYSLDKMLEAILGFLPENLRGSLSELVNTELDFSAPDIAGMVTNQVVAPIVTPFIMALLFFVFFSLVRLLVVALRSLASGLNKLPAIGTLNSALGAVAGVFIGALYVYLAFCVIWAYDSLGPAAPIEQGYFPGSFVMGAFSPLNFFSAAP